MSLAAVLARVGAVVGTEKEGKGKERWGEERKGKERHRCSFVSADDGWRLSEHGVVL